VNKVSIVIPVKNEEPNIPTLVKRIDRSFVRKSIGYELIFIDDRSTDNTVSTLKKLSSKYPVEIYPKKGKEGKAQSLLEGFTYANYDTFAMIDGDLQYPPEAIPAMMKKLYGNEDLGIIVANRVDKNTNSLRKIVSWGFRFFFVRVLHNLSYDAASGLKVFKREVIERMQLNPLPWAFDLEFLIRALDAGYQIDSVDVVFADRLSGRSKVNMLQASSQIGLAALQLKFRSPEIIPFHKNTAKKIGRGFTYKGQNYVHHSTLNHHESAVYQLVANQKLLIFLLAVVVILSSLIDWHLTLTVLAAIITVIYFIDLFFNFYLIQKGYRIQPEIKILPEELIAAKNRTWPTYTILCPLYREWQVLPQFVTAMSKLDYPKDKLQVLLLLEEDDKESISHIQGYADHLPKYFQILIVPHSAPKTKPKALNYGLLQAKGDYVVVYDAEDVPETKQLKKAILAFEKTDKKVVCLQSKLNFYNPHHNLLTRIFTAEYSLWFDLVLTGMQSVETPIPLGGTSNHFRTEDLRKLHAWDAFNVTEDADLGIRLAKKGYKTAILHSITLEEANSDFLNWVRQRTRWIKGYMQTYLVHTRDLGMFNQRKRKHQKYTFQLVLGSKILSTLINPFMWAVTFSYFAFRPLVGTTIESFFPLPVFYMGVFSFVCGNFLYLYYYMIGCAKRQHYDLIKYAYLVPFYWLSISYAGWLALIDLIREPHYWAKTVHGFHYQNLKAFNQATNIIGKKLVDQKITDFQPAFTQDKPIDNDQNKSKTWSIHNLINGSWLLGFMMLSNVLNFVFNAYLGRKISFEDFGLLTLVNTFWLITNMITTSLSATVNHRVAYLTAKVNKQAGIDFLVSMYKKSLKLAILFSAVWIAASPFLYQFFHLQNILPIIVFIPILILGLISATNDGFLQGNFYFVLTGIILLANPVTKLLSGYLLAASGYDSLAYLAVPIAVVIPFILSLTIVFRKIKTLADFSKPSQYYFPKRFFIATIATGLSTTMFLTLDVLLAKHFLTPRLAGQYALLSLVGKMIFFFGSLTNVFMVPFVSRDEGANRNTYKTFYRLFMITSILTFMMFLVVGPLGYMSLPILFGAKVVELFPYLIAYTLAVSFITITNTILTYHLTKHHYVFPILSFISALIMIIGVTLLHNGIFEIVDVVLVTSALNLLTMITLHFLYKKGTFVGRNLLDFFYVFLPLPKKPVLNTGGKKILIFNWRDTKHNFAGGAEVYIHELSKRWIEAGNSVTVFCGNDSNSPRYELIDKVEVIRRGGFYMVYVWAFLYYMLKFRGHYDLIIDSENGIPFFTPLYAKEKIFLLMHHVHQEVFRKSLKPPLSWIAMFLERRLMPIVYKNTQFITVSPSTKEEIMKMKLTTREPIIIYSGVDLTKFKPAEKSKTPLILYLGRLQYYKSLNVFIRAAKRVLEKLPQAEVVIAGDGEEKTKLKKLSKKLDVKVRFLGKVSEKQKVELFQKAWIFVNPSSMEGWGITTIEANACGTPVLASNVPGLRDSVNNPHTGYLFPYGKSDQLAELIIKLVENQDLRKKLSEESIDWAKQFDWKTSAANSLKILK